ncbi:hypothetical protein ACO9S2_08600 [Nitrospira sp. NS4]|uniref:hypothetical protein n=1 Tax=Nitrospira sp. NS4 TaxID=3414498 RepID=UPI003C2D351E
MLPRVSRSCLIALVLALSIGSAGCNVIRIQLNTPLTQDDVAFIEPGKTVLTEVIAKLGVPDSITESYLGVVATYRFLDMKYSRVNFGWLVKPWSPVDPDLIISRTGFGVDAFELYCDANWVVTHQSFLRQLSGTQFNPYPF